MTEIQIGDVVYLDKEFVCDYDSVIQIINTHPVFREWYVETPFFYAWLLRTKWVVYAIDPQFVWARCDMIPEKTCQNFFHWEVVPTGERIIPNDPSRYDRRLL